MSNTSNPMNLTVWDSATDVFDYTQLAANFTTIASHNHASGKGNQIDTAGIKNNAVNANKLLSDESNDTNRAVTANHIKNGAVTNTKLQDYSISGTGVSTGKIEDGAVTSAKLKNSSTDNNQRAVTTDHIKDGAVTVGKLASTVFTGFPSASTKINGTYGSITSGSWHRVIYNSVAYTNCNHYGLNDFISYTSGVPNGTLVARKAGLYHIQANICWDNVAPGGAIGSRRLRLVRTRSSVDSYLNETALNAQNYIDNYHVPQTVSIIVTAAVDDLFTVEMIHSQGSDMGIVNDINQCFTLTYIGPTS